VGTKNERMEINWRIEGWVEIFRGMWDVVLAVYALNTFMNPIPKMPQEREKC
jgi:hypothetical protein